MDKEMREGLARGQLLEAAGEYEEAREQYELLMVGGGCAEAGFRLSILDERKLGVRTGVGALSVEARRFYDARAACILERAFTDLDAPPPAPPAPAPAPEPEPTSLLQRLFRPRAKPVAAAAEQQALQPPPQQRPASAGQAEELATSFLFVVRQKKQKRDDEDGDDGEEDEPVAAKKPVIGVKSAISSKGLEIIWRTLHPDAFENDAVLAAIEPIKKSETEMVAGETMAQRRMRFAEAGLRYEQHMLSSVGEICYRLARMYAFGLGVDVSDPAGQLSANLQALEYLDRARRSNHPAALHLCGMIYSDLRVLSLICTTPQARAESFQQAV
jgi:hypothetical protein